MIRNLMIISGVGLVLAAAGIGGSLMVGGADLARHSWIWAINEEEGGINIRRASPDAARPADITRTIEWADTDRLTISLPGEVLYVQDGSAPAIIITGPQDLVERVTFTNGRLMMNEGSKNETAYVGLSSNGVRGWSDSDDLKITIKAATVNAFELHGNTDLEVRAYDQPSMKLVLTGNADIEAQGTTPSLIVDASGNSSAELDELLGEQAAIITSGNSGVKTAANGRVELTGSGNSRIRLTRQPRELIQNMSGQAVVRHD